MRLRRPLHRGASPAPFWGAVITWLPIPIGIVLGTLGRATALVVGGHERAAAVLSIVCAGAGAVLGAMWFWASVQADDWWGVAKLTAVWMVLTIAFRALWLGTVIGGGWAGVSRDYQVWQGQPGIPILLLVLLVPVITQWRRHRRGSGASADWP